MPLISNFYGITITMYFNEHNPPHFHVEYNGMEAQFDMTEGAFSKGSLPSKQARLVLAWFEIHREELFENWESLNKTGEYKRIEPLR